MVAGDILAAAVFLPDRSERKGLGLLHEREARGVVTVFLGLAQKGGGLEQSGEAAVVDAPELAPVVRRVEALTGDNALAYVQAWVMEHLPGPTLMSRDNVASMKVDNVASGSALGLSALDVHTPASLASVFTLP